MYFKVGSIKALIGLRSISCKLACHCLHPPIEQLQSQVDAVLQAQIFSWKHVSVFNLQNPKCEAEEREDLETVFPTTCAATKSPSSGEMCTLNDWDLTCLH